MIRHRHDRLLRPPLRTNLYPEHSGAAGAVSVGDNVDFSSTTNPTPPRELTRPRSDVGVCADKYVMLAVGAGSLGSMTNVANPKVTSDAHSLLAYMDDLGLDGAVQITRYQQHMGGLIVDSALQRQNKYAATVAPRVRDLIAAWPDADTTTGFRRRLDTEGLDGLGKIIRWSKPRRLEQIRSTAELFHQKDIDTVPMLSEKLTGGSPDRDQLRRDLDRIKYIGPKTLDYIDILAGLNDSAAIDSRIEKAATRAGISNLRYSHLEAVLRQAAGLRDWRVGDLDAVLWAAHAN